MTFPARPSIVALILLLALATRASAQSPDSLTGPGVSLSLARLRAATVRDVRYALRLDVTSLDSAVGTVTVRWRRTGSTLAVLDFRGSRVTSITVNGAAATHAAFNGRHLFFPATALRRGENSVTIGFVAEIAPSGASIIKIHDPDGSDYLYTLLVPADANQLFPCFDQPDLKATLAFALTAPRPWVTIANGSEQRADTAASAITHHFTTTRPLSTYLYAFAAGPWQRATSTVSGRTISLYVRASRMKEADTDTLLALSHRALGWMERYFDRPYPFEKFDLLLAPAFPFGGMEHPGLVMYNETGFIFRERPTLARRIGRFGTILHETAHQWFGDLVTMRWFDDLWLKEGFATYMAAKAQFDLDSSTGAWKTFYQSNKPSAYGVDQTLGTTPLWQELANLDQAKSNYGAIVYNKAPSVLKQLNFLVGDDAFQRGVRDFLTRYAYANATWQDLLGAVGHAADPRATRSLRGLTPAMESFGRNFMLRPGVPIVEQHLTVANGTIAALELAQRPAQSLSGTDVWPMRTQLLLSYGANAPAVMLPVTLTGRVTPVAAARGLPAPLFAFANHDDQGYFLTMLDSASVAALELGALGAVKDPLLRSMLWGALWDEVRDAQFDPARFARLALHEAPNESDEQILPGVLGRLSRAVTVYVNARARETLRPEVEQMLGTLANDARRSYGIRRAALDAFIGLAATSNGVTALERLLRGDSAAGEPMRDPTRWEIVTRLMVLDAPGASDRLVAQAVRDTTPDGRRRAFVAGAARRTAATKRDYFTRYFADKALNEDWASGSLGAFNAPAHAELTLPYLRSALDSLPFIQANRRIFFLGSWLGAFIGGHHDETALQVVRQFLGDHPALSRDLRQKVLQTADELERTVTIRTRWP